MSIQRPTDANGSEAEPAWPARIASIEAGGYTGPITREMLCAAAGQRWSWVVYVMGALRWPMDDFGRECEA